MCPIPRINRILIWLNTGITFRDIRTSKTFIVLFKFGLEQPKETSRWSWNLVIDSKFAYLLAQVIWEVICRILKNPRIHEGIFLCYIIVITSLWVSHTLWNTKYVSFFGWLHIVLYSLYTEVLTVLLYTASRYHNNVWEAFYKSVSNEFNVQYCSYKCTARNCIAMFNFIHSDSKITNLVSYWLACARVHTWCPRKTHRDFFSHLGIITHRASCTVLKLTMNSNGWKLF